jgi:HupE / UreJ protein
MFVRTFCRWWSALLFGLAILALAPIRSASAHDLAIDQVMLWPDPSAGALRGQLTFDPELTRSKDAQPSAAYELAVVEFLKANVQLTLDGRAVPISFQVRELWVRGGATLGDLVVFSVPLPRGARELRMFASDAFKALVVSVQRVREAGQVDTTSWLLGRGEWTPVYRIGAGWQQPGWRDGGPDVFLDTVGAADSTSKGTAASGSVASGSVASGSVADGSGAHRGAPTPAAPALSITAPTAVSAPADNSRAARPASLAAHFVRLGFEHILPGGVDHMLFVAGLVLGSARRYRQVLISLSLFTLAHTLTLGLGNFHILSVPPRIVEPLIAFSIFLLGVDNLRARTRAADSRDAGRYAVVFCFGLIHGLGFANALSELAFDRSQLVLALFSFNLGVELGQIVVVGLLALMLYLIRERRSLERYATLAGSAAIAMSGLFMVFERLVHMGEAPASISQTESCRHEV